MPQYDWQRFWLPRGTDPDLSDRGYLVDPESARRWYASSHCIGFESLNFKPCLALLGEPGIGKTNCIEQQFPIVKSAALAAGDCCLRFDLRAYKSDGFLAKEIFESAAFVSWMNGNNNLYLYLDSLDECLLSIETVCHLLANKFRDCAVSRLKLRIACRTADWPTSFEAELKQFWKIEDEIAYELAPLRRDDVTLAAEHEGIDARKFLDEIARVEVAPLAIKPVTLNFLLRLFKANSELPKTQKELYVEGLLLLCKESNDSRRTTRRSGEFSAHQRFAVARRIAAITVFGNRYGVVQNVLHSDDDKSDLNINDIVGGTEKSTGNIFEINERAIDDTLRYSALFSSKSEGRWGWAHLTYAEFLAASYVVEHGATDAQILSVIQHPSDPQGKLVPQLHQVAAWIADLSPSMFMRLMEIEPDVLLRSDISTVDEQTREKLSQTLLCMFADGRLLDHSWDRSWRFSKIAHTNLSKQIRPYLTDKSANYVVRRVSMAMIRECRLSDLSDDVASIALDAGEDHHIRTYAALTLNQIGNRTEKCKLRPLVFEQVGPDPDDQLKGYGLEAAWPDCLTAKELFDVLTPLKKNNLRGSYSSFIESGFVKHLRPDDVVFALDWIARGAIPLGDFKWDQVPNEIMWRGWHGCDQADVLEKFADAVLSRTDHYYAVFDGEEAKKFDAELQIEVDKRRRLAAKMVDRLLAFGRDPNVILFGPLRLICSNDCEWLLEQAELSKSAEERTAWSTILYRSLLWIVDHANTKLVADRANRTPEIEAWFENECEAVLLSSRKAREMKRAFHSHLGSKRIERRLSRKKVPPLKDWVVEQLTKFEAGDVDGWWRAIHWLEYDPKTGYENGQFEADLRRLPGWEVATIETRQRIKCSAQIYLQVGDPLDGEWLGKQWPFRPAINGYRALCLLHKEEPETLAKFSQGTWTKWAAAILSFPDTNGSDNDSYFDLIQSAYRHAPNRVREAFIALLDREVEEGKYVFVTRKLKPVWDDDICGLVFEMLQSKPCSPKVLQCLMTDLLEADYGPIRIFTENLFEQVPESDEGKQKRLIAACALASYFCEGSAIKLFQLLKMDYEFAKSFFCELDHTVEWKAASFFAGLTEKQLVELFLIVSQAFPAVDEDDRGTRSSIRQVVIDTFKSKANAETCEAIRELMTRSPKDAGWLDWVLRDIELLVRRKTWEPATPHEIVVLFKDRQKCLVENGDQLLDAIIASLETLEKRFHAETPAVVDLWNQTPIQPKDEEEVSNYIKRHFESDLGARGVVLNREVQIRRNTTPTPGERTDILVNAVLPGNERDGFGVVSVTIEAKCCFNQGLVKDFERQLVKRYLRESRCRHGLYLVAWFNCKQWDKNDPRRRRSPEWSISQARQFFEAQAREFSTADLKVRAFVLDAAHL